MIRKLYASSALLLVVFSQLSFGMRLDPELENLKNDKEVKITTIKESEVEKLRKLHADGKFAAQLNRVFLDTLQEYIDDDYHKCEQRLILTLRSRIRDDLFVKVDEESMVSYFKLLRVSQYIDDILFEILMNNNKDFFRLAELRVDKKPFHTILDRESLLKQNDLKELYADFKTWPDEYESCSYNNYIILKKKFRTKNGEVSKKAKEMKVLNKKALEAGVITLESYRKLEYLRNDSSINKRTIWLDDYLNIIYKAKNKMVPLSQTYKVVDLSKENSFSSEHVRRFSSLTRRKLLYQKYNETQIVLLAQVLQKASMRMGVDPDTETLPPVIVQEFRTLQPGGTRTTYVEKIELDPQSQYNLARRLLRKDMTQLQMMDTFTKLKITHEDIVMAALETGYISLEDLEYVIKYDDLWNPHKSTFERVLGFVFRIAGYSTFFLPPPWNVAASIAMGVTEGLVINKLFKTGVDNDNPATFIE